MRSVLCPFKSFRLALAAAVVCVGAGAADAQRASPDDLISGVVQIKTVIDPDGRTVKNLGRERDGSGVVIDNNGLILTIGYLMVEAYAAQVTTSDGRSVPANIVGYDYDSGLGLLQAVLPIKAQPIALGRSAEVKERDQVLIVPYGGIDRVSAVRVVAKREFAGTWEYLLDDAIFTAPLHRAWSGAALIGRDGRLVGIGSLVVGDATGKGDGVPGNMFVPIDRLPPILSDLMTDGRPSGRAKPWLGVTTNETSSGRLQVAQVTPDGPAEKAGIRRGDVISAVNGIAPAGLADFYRKVWAAGDAGVLVPLEIERDNDKRRIDVPSMNRLDHLKLKSTF